MVVECSTRRSLLLHILNVLDLLRLAALLPPLHVLDWLRLAPLLPPLHVRIHLPWLGHRLGHILRLQQHLLPPLHDSRGGGLRYGMDVLCLHDWLGCGLNCIPHWLLLLLLLLDHRQALRCLYVYGRVLCLLRGCLKHDDLGMLIRGAGMLLSLLCLLWLLQHHELHLWPARSLMRLWVCRRTSLRLLLLHTYYLLPLRLLRLWLLLLLLLLTYYLPRLRLLRLRLWLLLHVYELP